MRSYHSRLDCTQVNQKNRTLSAEIKKKDKQISTKDAELGSLRAKVESLQNCLNIYCDENMKLKNKMRVKSDGKSEVLTKKHGEDGTSMMKELSSLKNELVTLKNTFEREMKDMKNERRRESSTTSALSIPSKAFGSLRFSSNNQQSRENSPDESGKTIPLDTPIIPGICSYSSVTAGKKVDRENIHIFSSSMCRDISEEEFNLKLNKGTSQIHLFRGKKAKEIGVGVKEHLDSKKKTDAVIILGGGNDLPTSKNNPTSPSIVQMLEFQQKKYAYQASYHDKKRTCREDGRGSMIFYVTNASHTSSRLSKTKTLSYHDISREMEFI